MIITPLSVFIASAILFIALALLVQIEEAKGRRLVLGGVRGYLDVSLVRLNAWRRRQWEHFVQYFVKLGWYYSMHSFLRTTLQVLVALYNYIESKFEHNRERTKHLRDEKQRKIDAHLAAMAEHKAEVALTPREQAALRRKKLEERH